MRCTIVFDKLKQFLYLCVTYVYFEREKEKSTSIKHIHCMKIYKPTISDMNNDVTGKFEFVMKFMFSYQKKLHCFVKTLN